jgi:hypothetical protein
MNLDGRGMTMTSYGRKLWRVGRGAVVCAVLVVGCERIPAQDAAAAPAVPSARDAAAIQQPLVELVKMSPTLRDVVERDPSLLSDTAYVSRNNPELAAFLTAHPEVVRNPDFYLFSEFHEPGVRYSPGLERRGPGRDEGPQEDPSMRFFANAVMPFLVFLCVLAAVIWMIHVFVQNRRWTRMQRLQMEAHGKLMDRFGSNAELMAYMSSEAGRRFLEAAPIALDAESGQRMPNAVSRVLISMQVGTVLTLLGVGLLLLRNTLTDQRAPLLMAGTLFLMPGLGFLVSAVLTWMFAARLGMIPGKVVSDTGERR